MPNKLLGQHFLKNAAVAQKIVTTLRPERGEIVFEIGAGHGELTRFLAEACAKNGCTLFSIEKDPHLAEQLAAERPAANTEVLSGDALDFFRSERFKKLVAGAGGESGAGVRPYRIVGNIPYYLTGRLLRIISELDPKPARCVLMVQKEVAERVTAKPPKMNRLAAIVQFSADVTVAAQVPRENFDPAPKVDSAIVSLDARDEKTRADIPPDRYYAAVRALFAQPRKTLRNNLGEHKTREEKEVIAAALAKIGIKPELRPQTLTTEEITAIAKALF